MTKERVLITGGAAGIGAACAERCKADGYDVVVIDRVGNGLLADLSDPQATSAALERALEDGPITRLVNNVGVVVPASAEAQSLEELERAWALNVRCAQQCMSSRAALGKELRTAYSATKAALIGMTRVWALELGAFGVTANAIGPGPIRTELFDRANPPDAPRTRAIIESVPVRRVGTPDDVAHAASYLLDARSGFVTGQVLYVCGGMTVGVAGV
jgi:NAD(P)-dependent dehydrogenase (short-subunit alcohol dehydrogenase family)